MDYKISVKMITMADSNLPARNQVCRVKLPDNRYLIINPSFLEPVEEVKAMKPKEDKALKQKENK